MTVSNSSLPGHIVVALKRALSTVYWLKRDLREFVQTYIQDTKILVRLDWDLTKREIVDQLINQLSEKNAVEELLKISHSIIKMTDFSHLKFETEGEKLIQKAKDSVNQLKMYKDDLDKILTKIDTDLEDLSKKLSSNSDFSRSLSDLHKEFLEMHAINDFQKRGYAFEALINKTFSLFEISTRNSFKNGGEQIDGAFSIDGTEYLMEAKWTKNLIGIDEIDVFSSKISRKLDNTLGLLISCNGFKINSGQIYTGGNRKLVLLMDAIHLINVYENRIRLPELIRRMKQHGAQTGEIYFPASMLS
jgi:hypothetical protein